MPVEAGEPFVPGVGDPRLFTGKEAWGLLLFWKISQQRKGKPLVTVTRLLHTLAWRPIPHLPLSSSSPPTPYPQQLPP